MINARVETLTQRPAFRGLRAAHRCLVPASGSYEWKRDGRDKTPYDIHPRSNPYVAFAGLYDRWTQPTGEDLYSFTIITTDADEYTSHLHTRMPVMLARNLEEAWLDPEITSAPEVLELLRRSAGVTLGTYPVSRLVNKASVEGEQLIQRVD